MTSPRIEAPDPRAPSSRAPVSLLAAWRPDDGFLFDRSGRGVAGAGTQAAEELAEGPGQLHAAAAAADRLLQSADGRARDDAVAVAALAYDGGVASRIFVPARALRMSAAGPGELEASSSPVRDERTLNLEGGRPSRRRVVTVREEPSARAYASAVAEAVRRIRAGELEKVVLARCLMVDGAGRDDAVSIVSRLRDADPDCYTFAVSGGPAAESLFVGATPELLVRRSGLSVASTPLGGSTPRCADPAADRLAGERLLASGKDRREHALVVEAVTDTLAPFCGDLRVLDRFTLTSTAGMWHLGSTVRGVLRPSAPTALGLAAALHPTPAICGTPRERALQVIGELETVPRGLYSGIVGWVDRRGDGEWAVAIRCAELSAGRARLYAGAGIVEGSDPDAEVAETAAKFSALIDALGG